MGGCGCSGLAGLRGLGQDLIDYALDDIYTPQVVTVPGTFVPIQTISSPMSQTLNQPAASTSFDLSSYFNTLMGGGTGQIAPVVPNVNNQAAANKLKSDSSWPILALLGVGALALMAG